MNRGRLNGTIGGSATMAVDVLKSRGVPENRILFLNLIASPEGIDSFAKRFPKLRVVTAFIDQVGEAQSSYGVCKLTFYRASMRRSRPSWHKPPSLC